MTAIASLSPHERQLLKDIARSSIRMKLEGQPVEIPAPTEKALLARLGAFVTLSRDGRLRGCIGNLVGQGPLYRTVSAMALAAAFQDHRFPPLSAAEFPSLAIEISVMSAITPCPDPQAVKIGKHGLIMRRGNQQGLLLPQVPVEHGWDRAVFLAQTCVKAGLPPDAWQDGETAIFWFEALVF